MKPLMLVFATLLGTSHICYAADSAPYVEIKDGFVTGRDYLEMPEGQREVYAVGVIDGLLLAPFLGNLTHWPSPCVTGMTSRQAAAMLTHELQQNPGTWHQSAHMSMYKAVLAACPR